MFTLTFVTVLFVASGVFGAPAPEGRIVNGTDAALGEIPYIVSLRGQNRHGCGGSILNEKYVLTAAHCVYSWDHRPDLFSIQYGIVEISEKVPNVVPVKKITIHEGYVHSGSYPNDVAIIEIDGVMNLNENAKPVTLPTPFEEVDDFDDVLLAGWGLNQSGGHIMMHLQKVTLKKFSDDFCSAANSKYNSEFNICAGIIGGGKGQCTADSGGPLAINGKQFGIVSWSIKPCASPGNPGMFTKVSSVRNWIRLQTGV